MTGPTDDGNGDGDGDVDGDSNSDDRTPPTPDDALDALEEGFGLKDERRTGWQLRGVDDPESVAAHAWGVSLLCLAFADEAGVDPDRALRLATIHDLAEARTGDAPTRADPADEPITAEEKERRERAAMADLAGPFPAIDEAWAAYERRDTPEARFVKDMDLVDMCLQALVYERQGRYDADGAFDSDYDRLDEFFATAEPRLSTEVGRKLYDDIRAEYDALAEGRDDESP